MLPPVYFLAALLLMAGLHVAVPIRQVIEFPYRYFGVLFVLGGTLLVGAAVRLFGKAGTAIKPFQEASALVIRGPYRLTRTPMYVRLVTVLVGIALLLGSLAPGRWSPSPLAPAPRLAACPPSARHTQLPGAGRRGGAQCADPRVPQKCHWSATYTAPSSHLQPPLTTHTQRG